MSDGYIQVPVDSTGKKIDAEALTVNGQTVQRQRINISDPQTDVGHARVKNAPPVSDDYGLTVREAPTGLLETAVNISTPGDHNLIAAVAGQVITVWKLMLRSNGDNTLSIRDGTTPLMGAIDLAQGGDVTLQKDSDPWFTLAANSPFNLNTTQAVQLSGRVYYRQG